MGHQKQKHRINTLKIYFGIAKNIVLNLKVDLDWIKTFIEIKNFWLNFSLNFNDKSFENLVKIYFMDDLRLIFESFNEKLPKLLGLKYDFNEENDEEKKNMDNLMENICIIFLFMKSTKKLNKKLDYEMLGFLKNSPNFYLNIENIESYLHKKFNTYGKAILDSKGNFIYADSEICRMYNKSDLKGLNFFQLCSKHTLFLLKKRTEKFLFDDLTSEKTRKKKFRHSHFIQGQYNDEKKFFAKGDDIRYQCQIFLDQWNTHLTLSSEFKIVNYFHHKKEVNQIVVQMKTRLSKRRFNFDEFSDKY